MTSYLNKLFDFQECDAPCTTLDIESRLLRKVDSVNKGIKLSFDPNVRMTKSVPTMDFMTLLSNIGGVIGLTLGYSILQMVEGLDVILRFMWKKIGVTSEEKKFRI